MDNTDDNNARRTNRYYSFSIAYEVNTTGHLTPCWMGSHLEECNSFQCNQKYKCPGYYCIPFAYVCDGKQERMNLIHIVVGILRILNNMLTDIKLNMFNNMPVKYIGTNDFHICCITPTTIHCSAVKPWYTSCSKLFPNNSMRISFISILLIVLIGNVLSLGINVFKITKVKQNISFNLIVANINTGYLMCGLTLVIIWIADMHYDDSFVVNDLKWRGHMICFIIFNMSIIFSIMMPFSLTCLSVARLMVVKYPFKTHKNKVDNNNASEHSTIYHFLYFPL